MNNSIAAYAAKGKNYSTTISLLTRVHAAAGVHLVGYHRFWTLVLNQLEVNIPVQLNLHLLDMDGEKVKRFHRDHDFQTKKKRKRLEHEKFKKEFLEHQKDVARNATYESRTGCAQSKEKEMVSTCKHAKFGCKGKQKHKTERSKHCDYHKDKLGGITLVEAQRVWSEKNQNQSRFQHR